MRATKSPVCPLAWLDYLLAEVNRFPLERPRDNWYHSSMDLNISK